MSKASASERWHKKMYDEIFAKRELASDRALETAEAEVELIANHLGLVPGGRVLDIPCGTGRHSKALALRGFDVTGVDINPSCVRMAGRVCAGLNARFRVGNMKSMRWARGRFDLVINMNRSFGYFPTDEANESVLDGMVCALRPGGTLVIQTYNRDYVAQHHIGGSWGEDKDVYWNHASKFDKRNSVLKACRVLVEKRGLRPHRYYWELRLYSAEQMSAMLERRGLKVTVFGGPKGEPFDPAGSAEPIYFATLPPDDRGRA
jgi:SAM-dependent methyltransferase